MLKLGLGLQNINMTVSGEEEVPAELISHWIADNRSAALTPNEVGGKPDLSGVYRTANFNGHQSWYCSTGGSAPATVTGVITSINGDYSFVFALYTGDGHDVAINQRMLSNEDSLSSEVFDIVAYYKDDNTLTFVPAIGSPPWTLGLNISTLGDSGAAGGDTVIITLIFKSSDIIVYRDGVLRGTISDGYPTQGKLNGVLALNGYFGGGSNSLDSGAMAEMKVYDGELSTAQRLADESAMATSYGVIF